MNRPSLFLVLQGVLVAYILFRLVRLRSSIPPNQRKLIDAVKRAEELRKTDPAAADRLLDEVGLETAEEEKRLREDLWLRAPSDPKAARLLRKRLAQDLEADEAARKHFMKRLDQEPNAREVLKTIDESSAATREEIARLDRMLGTQGHER